MGLPTNQPRPADAQQTQPADQARQSRRAKGPDGVDRRGQSQLQEFRAPELARSPSGTAVIEDAELVAAVAQAFIAQRGVRAIDELDERAAFSAAAGDHLSAEAWRDIAEAARKLLDA